MDSVKDFEISVLKTLKHRDPADDGDAELVRAFFSPFLHEVRNPLSVIRMNAELLFEDLSSRGPSDSSRIRRAPTKATTIIRQVDLIEGLLDRCSLFLLAQRIERCPVHVRDAARDAVGVVEGAFRARGIEILVSVEDQLKGTAGDRAMLTLAIIELLKNTLDSVESGGMVSICACDRGSSTSVEIVDNGQGIQAGVEDRLFCPFFSTRPGHTGMGLAIVRRIVSAHGGNVAIRTSLVGGVHCEIVLPTQPES